MNEITDAEWVALRLKDKPKKDVLDEIGKYEIHERDLIGEELLQDMFDMRKDFPDKESI